MAASKSIYWPDVSALDHISMPQQIQNIHDSMPWRGDGTIKIPLSPDAAWDMPHQVDIKKQVIITSDAASGGSQFNAGMLPSACTLKLPSGGVGFYFGDPNEALFSGGKLSSVAFIPTDGTGTPLIVDRMSKLFVDEVNISGFAGNKDSEATFPVVFRGEGGQYSQLDRVSIHGCKYGIDLDGHNGVQITRTYIDPANNSGNVMNGSIGIRNRTGGTHNVCLAQIQGCESGIDMAGENNTVQGRFEANNVSVRFRGNGLQILPGCSFNGHMGSVGGICVDITEDANVTIIHPFTYGAMDMEPVRDRGHNTKRLDACSIMVNSGSLPIDRRINVPLGCVPSDGSAKPDTLLRKFAAFNGGVSIPASQTDYWSFRVSRLNKKAQNEILTIDTRRGFDAYASMPFPDYAGVILLGDFIGIDCVPTGNPPPMQYLCFSALLVPY